MATLATTIATTAGAVADIVERTLGAVRRASATHHGQCCPTVAGIAHRPQMGRSQREQRSLVGTSGCPAQYVTSDRSTSGPGLSGVFELTPSMLAQGRLVAGS